MTIHAVILGALKWFKYALSKVPDYELGWVMRIAKSFMSYLAGLVIALF